MEQVENVSFWTLIFSVKCTNFITSIKQLSSDVLLPRILRHSFTIDLKLLNKIGDYKIYM